MSQAANSLTHTIFILVAANCKRRCNPITSKRLRLPLCLGLLVCLLLLWPCTLEAAPETVEKITVSVTSQQRPPDKIAKRMTASVATVGEQMLLGRTIDDVIHNQTGYEKLVREIFDRVLVGYSVSQVTITPGENTHIHVVVTPWGDVVQTVILEVDSSGFSPELATMIKTDMGNVENQVNSVLIGLPIDAVEWAGGVSKSIIREILAEKLPEFRCNLEIDPGQHTKVKLSLLPTGSLIQEVNLVVRSRTIPNLLLGEVTSVARESANTLRGLPVAFVERHKEYFTAQINTAAAKHPLAAQYGLTLTPVINPGSQTEVVLKAETTKYRISLEGSLDVGRIQDNATAKLHVGKFVGKKDELFMEVSFIPSTVSWIFEPGWGHKFSEMTTAGVRYNTSENYSTVWLNQYLNNNWTLRFERTQKTNYNEFGVRYKLHEFLSAEYVFTQKENWLRLIANL